MALVALLYAIPALAQGNDASRRATGYAPPRQPFLQIESGFHTAPVNNVALAARAPVLVSGSNDKTVRVWDANDGSLQSTIRVPLDVGLEGAIASVAVSPDGKTIVAGAYSRIPSLFLMDAERGEVIKRVTVPGLATAIAFSPAGDRFAAAVERSGVYLLDSGASLLRHDKDLLRPVGVAFAGDGRFAVVTFDGTVRLYAPDGQPRSTRKLSGAGNPNSVAFSPSGDLLAIGFEGNLRIEILSTTDLATRLVPDVSGIAKGDLANVAFVVDGPTTYLIAGGAISTPEGEAIVYGWSEAGLGQKRPIAKAKNTIMTIAANLSGKIAIGTADPSLMIFQHGKQVSRLEGATIDFRYVSRGRLATDMNGTRFQFSTDKGLPLEIVDIAGRDVGTYRAEKYPTVEWFAPLAKATTAQVASWRLSQQTKVAGKAVEFRPGERSHSADVSPQGLVALGTDMRLRLFTPAGQELKGQSTTTPVYGLVFSGNGARLIAALGDGTLQIHDVDKDGLSPPRLTIFVHKNRESWVAWTPEGFFDHSERAGGQDLVGYVLNRSLGRSPEWLTFSQLYKTLYAPSLVEKRLVSEQGGEAEIQGRIAALGDVRQQYEKAIPPVVVLSEICSDQFDGEPCRGVAELARRSKRATLLAPSSDDVAMTDGDTGQKVTSLILSAAVTKVTLRYAVIAREGGVGDFDLVVNDVNRGRSKLRSATLRNNKFVEREIAIDGVAAIVTARAYDATDTIFGEAPPISIRNNAQVGPSSQGDLYVLVAGIDDYKEGRSWFKADGSTMGYEKLDLARSDAESFARAVTGGSAKLFRNVHLFALFDEAATRAAIVDALTDIARRAGPNDTVLVYLAGHGDKVETENRKFDFMYVTANVDIVANTEREKKAPLQGGMAIPDFMGRVYPDALKGRDLVQLLSELQATKVMVFLDTCHSGTVNLFSRDLDVVGSLSAEAGRYILAAAADEESALDSYVDRKAGVFATAVLRALGGQGGIQRDRDGTINQIALGFYVQETLPKLVYEVKATHKQSARFMVAARHAAKFPVSRPQALAK